MPVDIFAKRFFAGIVAVILAIAAYFQASGVSQLIGAGLLEEDKGGELPAHTQRTGAAPTSVVTRATKSIEAVIKRNPFDSVTGALDKLPEQAAEEPVQNLDLSNPLAVADCEGIEAIIITESVDPLWSLAALKGGGEDKPTMKRVGDKVGDRDVAFIGYNPFRLSPSVWLVNGSSLCQVLLFKQANAPVTQPPAGTPPPAPVASTEPSPEPPRASGAAKIPDELAAKIQKVSETEFSLERSVIDEVMENQAMLMRSARIVPEQKNGETIGVRLFGIRPDTLLGTLGIQNGDRLEEINGFKMGSPEQALEAYARLRSAGNLTVKVNRRGKPLTIDYTFK